MSSRAPMPMYMPSPCPGVVPEPYPPGLGAMRVVNMVVNERALPPSEGDRAFAALADAARHAGLAEREIMRTLQSARARA